MKTKRLVVLFAALLMFGAAMVGFAAKSPKGIEVTFSFRDAPTDRIWSCQNGGCSYSASIAITSDPAAPQIISGGSFYFDFTGEPSCPSTGCRNPFGTVGTGEVQTSFSLSECTLYPLHAMLPGQVQLCAFKPNPSDPEGDERWRLRFDPTPFIDGAEPVEGIGTRVTVTCTRGSLQCTEWTIEATPGATAQVPDTDIGFLINLPAKGRLVETWAGSYSMPFQMIVTKR